MLPPLSEELKKEAIDAYEKAGGIKAEAARILGINVNTYKKRYAIATKHQTVTPEHIEPLVPDGQKLRGVSNLYRPNPETGENELVLQWVKTNEDHARLFEMLEEAVEALKADIPKEPPAAYVGQCNDDLLSQYTITDYHLGMMAKAAEAGTEWDTEKSVNFLVKWIAAAIAAAPPSKVAILCQLGDFLHFDSMEPVTPTSKHLMDTDSRYCLIVNIAVKVLRIIIQMLLQKHEQVHVIMAEGNHDMSSSIWLRALFADKYENEPRVTVDNSHLPYYAYEWGKTSLFYHHGHRKKMSSVSQTFASNYREMYGRTVFSYGHTGHYHHAALKEDGIMIVEQHPTMAPNDAYSSRGGYNAHRGATVITYSREHGEVSRATIRPEMINL